MPTVAQVDLDVHIVSAQVDELPRFADGAVPTDLYAIEGDVDAIRFEVRGSGSDRCQNPPPVGVLPKNRAFEQVAARDRPADLNCVLLRGCTLHLDSDGVCCAFGVGYQLPGKILAGLG